MAESISNVSNIAKVFTSYCDSKNYQFKQSEN